MTPDLFYPVSKAYDSAVEVLLTDRDFLAFAAYALVGSVLDPAIEQHSDMLEHPFTEEPFYPEDANELELFKKCMSYLDLQWSDYCSESIDHLMHQAARYAIKISIRDEQPQSSYLPESQYMEELLKHSLCIFLIDKIAKTVDVQRLRSDFTDKAAVTVERDLRNLSFIREFRGQKIELREAVIDQAMTELNAQLQGNRWLGYLTTIAEFAEYSSNCTWIWAISSDQWDSFRNKFLDYDYLKNN